ncbi:isoprenyl transferase [Pedobacter sp. HMF7647]|uniref:Isoprenyl transferase n=1 Tax=Hufsiella arboris TaxID=2695275 RepID=A0A7K1YA03_9SPHI|nr:isoprenyl transferase [Hufsiella arboris]MXV51417.1 isoprenyl transferase [Hufsiella arboris]
MSLREQLDMSRLPQHVAIIMDGNGRWAKEKGKLRVFGHHSGVISVRDTVEGIVELGIPYITLYAFSTENWNRPKLEVLALMELLVHTISNETKSLHQNGVRLNAIGNLDSLPPKCLHELNEAMAKTANNTRAVLTLALSYSSRWEITNALKEIATKVQKKEISPDDINETLISNSLTTAGMPDPELLIRTSGEYRISNFLLWQLAYAELYFTNKFWPDFRKEDLFHAILDYQNRERRFGLTSEQIN